MSDPIANMPRGIDVSKHQGSINWNRVAGAGIRFGFARAIDDASSQGTSPDPFFARNFAGMRDVGIFRGAYYFFRPRHNVVTVANRFVSIVGALGPGDLQPVIDVEALPNLPAATMLDLIARWMDIVEGALGRQVIIYTNPDTWINRLRNSTRFSDHPLWIASLRNVPQVPSAFPTFTFHQHSFTGRIPGITGDVDLDRFNGSINGLRAFAGLPPIAGPLGLTDAGAAAAVAPVIVTTVKAAPARLSSANSAKTAGGKRAAAKKKSAKKGSAKKSATKKGSGKKAAAKKAGGKAGAGKRQSARKGSAKKGAKRSSKKAR